MKRERQEKEAGCVENWNQEDGGSIDEESDEEDDLDAVVFVGRKKTEDEDRDFVPRSYLSLPRGCHTIVACQKCRRLKAKCDGGKPHCGRCVKIGKESECIYDRATRFIKPRQKRDKETKGDGAKEVNREETATRTTRNNHNAETECIVVEDRNEKELRGAQETTERIQELATEVILADAATASFLMGIFTCRILPHLMVSYSLPDSLFFSSSLSPNQYHRQHHGGGDGDSLFSTSTAAQQMQRDGALALACRNCGHEELAKLLISRMEQVADVVKDEFCSSMEGLVPYIIYVTLISSDDMSKALNAFRVAMSMQATMAMMAKGDGGDFDPVDALCSPLERVDLSRDPFHDGISPSEIVAQVQYGAQQFASWAATLDDMGLRNFVAISLQMRSRMTTPQLRPAATLIMTLTVDLQLLGGVLVPPYLADLLHRHDPHNRFGVPAFFNPSASIEPFALSPELASIFHRRVAVVRRLLFASSLPKQTITPPLMTVESLNSVLYLRSGDLRMARSSALDAIRITETNDLNFWPPIVLPNLFLFASVFFETKDRKGLERMCTLFSQLQRSNPAAKCVVSAIMEMISKLDEETTNDTTVTTPTATAKGKMDYSEGYSSSSSSSYSSLPPETTLLSPFPAPVVDTEQPSWWQQ